MEVEECVAGGEAYGECECNLDQEPDGAEEAPFLLDNVSSSSRGSRRGKGLRMGLLRNGFGVPFSLLAACSVFDSLTQPKGMETHLPEMRPCKQDSA